MYYSRFVTCCDVLTILFQDWRRDDIQLCSLKGYNRDGLLRVSSTGPPHAHLNTAGNDNAWNQLLVPRLMHISERTFNCVDRVHLATTIRN